MIPIADPLLPYLKAAIDDAPGPLLFPDGHGDMRSPETDPQKVLRHALARAGLVEGYKTSAGGANGTGRFASGASPTPSSGSATVAA